VDRRDRPLRRERSDAGDAGDDREHSELLASSWSFAEHSLAECEQEQQAHRERWLDNLERREQQRHDLQRPGCGIHRRTDQPAPAAEQVREQRQAQRVLVAGHASIDRLEADP